ncbi:peptide-methionine (S)-S-oxide reductase, partial [Solemya elarraichensis gill symbiont]
MSIQIATLGGGCFWCLEAAFARIDGVISVKSGYAGGRMPNPSYEQVCDEITGHAEVVRIEFDSEIIDYATLLEVFFAIHE